MVCVAYSAMGIGPDNMGKGKDSGDKFEDGKSKKKKFG